MADKKMITRDTKRRVEVITKKISDLKSFGVPSLFVYATPWTGGLSVVGDDRLCTIVRTHKDEFLDKLKQELQDNMTSPKLILPELPQPINDMNGRTLCSILIGLGKDLSIDWKGEKPEWWPDAIPFVHPRETPPQLKGNMLHNIVLNFYVNLCRKMASVPENNSANHLQNICKRSTS